MDFTTTDTEAIGAPPNSAFINLDNGHGFDYTSNQSLLVRYMSEPQAGLKVLVYEGDVDACSLQTSNVEACSCLCSITMNKTRGDRTVGSDMGGYVIEWAHRNAQFVFGAVGIGASEPPARQPGDDRSSLRGGAPPLNVL